MNFLQPWMLIALPLAAIPIIIHLINQRRYQTTQWAAMMFLLTANRMNRGYARIRQWLILAFRALVIAALVLAVGRPLVSGSLGNGIVGSVFQQGSATAIVLVDRSPSMQARVGSSPLSKLDSGITQISDALETMGVGRVVLIESNTMNPQELDSPNELVDLPQVGPSDATADLPAMLLAALDYINANRLGQTDVWICSDLRGQDWRSEDGRWRTLREAYAELGRRIRIRLMAMPEVDSGNRRIRVATTSFVPDPDEPVVSVSLKIQDDADHAKAQASREQDSKTLLPVTFDLQGTRSTVEVEIQNGVGELVGHRLPLPAGQTRGHGLVSIPADMNVSDNQFYFTFDVTPPRRSVIVTDDEEVGRVLKLAAEIATDDQAPNVAEVVSPEQVGSIRWDEIALVLWHAPLPTDDSQQAGDATAIESFVNRGGRVVFFPPETFSQQDQSHEIFSMRWDDWQKPAEELAVSTWRGDSDVLSATLAGSALPLGRLRVSRFAGLIGDATPLAKLADGSSLLARVATRQGGVYFCATTPRSKDSSLAADGVVLYVLVQRALAEGAKSLGNTRQLDAGESDWQAAMDWRRLSGRQLALSTENAFVAGVYQASDNDHWLAVNRSVAEDATATLNDQTVSGLFEGLVFDRVAPQAGGSSALVEEAWRAFLIVMLIAMIGEACLCLPRIRSAEVVESSGRMDHLAGGGAT